MITHGATGKTNSVRLFIEKACNLLDIKIVWKNRYKSWSKQRRIIKLLFKVNPNFIDVAIELFD